MRSVFLAVTCILVLGMSALWSVRADRETVKVRLRLVDAETGKGLGGMVRGFPKDGDKPIPLPGLFDRLRGLQRSATVAGWHVVGAAGAETSLPRAPLRLEGVSGLETTLEQQTIDLAAAAPKEITLKLRSVFRPEQHDLVAGNTHLHLRNLTQDEADEYLRQIPAADGLKVMFISYLERFQDDASYITNRYPIGDLKQFTATGVLFNNGEEHRHNFEGFGQGYGHVMLLNIKHLVKPVSIGPGIMKDGLDEPSLSIGIDDARKQGGTVIWCHNTFGHESTPNALAGRLDALNVFDGSRTGSFEDKYYRFLNVGLRMPLSTGTDWFMYDWARVYARVNGPLTIPRWLEAVKAGRCVATNSPLLSLSVDGKPIGEVISLQQPRPVKVEATAIGRHDFQQLQLVHNGKVVAAQAAAGKEGIYSARLAREVKLDGPAWFAVRIESQAKTEFDARLFAHSSPVYVDVAGQRVFDLEAARALLGLLEEGQAAIRARGKFSGEAARTKVLAVYEQAGKELMARIKQRGG
jgi:hypothetical protein